MTIKEAFKSFLRLGFKKFFLVIIGIVYNRIFDIIHNVDTLPHLDQSILIKKGLKKHSLLNTARYDESSYLSLKKLFSSLEINNNDILLDVGCGKGIVMMTAIEFNFLEVRGFDHSKYLSQICLKNLNHYNNKIRTKTTYKVAEKSALHYVFKEDETILYFYNPFTESITQEFIKKIYNSIKKRKRKVRIISRGWNCESVLNQFFKFKKKEYVFWGKSYIVFTLEHYD